MGNILMCKIVEIECDDWIQKVGQYIIGICTGILCICFVTLVNMEDTIADGEMGNIVMLNETDIPGGSLYPVN